MQAVRTALLAFGVLATLCGAAAAQPAAATRPLVIVAELDGIIHPISAEFMTGTIDQADAAGADLVVFVLRTPGGLVESTQTIVSRLITSRARVAMFVAPSGARAASAGFILVLSADIAAMAPGTHIGAAHPVAGGGGQMDETMSKKAASDVAAYARSLAESRKRNVQLSAEAVTESRAFTDREALEAEPPLIDLVASDVNDLLRQLDGRSISRFDGRTAKLSITNAEQRRVEMTRRQRLLSTIAHPQIAALLLTLGMLGLTVELWNPGAIVPGVVGGLCLLLAFFAFQVIPVNVTGLLLIAFGVALLLLELKVPSFGALGIGGTIALLVGAVMLTNDVPGVPVSYGMILPLVLAFAVVFLMLGNLALRAHRSPVVTGREGLLRAFGQALSPIGPITLGQVRVHGEIWRASSSGVIEAGTPVRVKGVDGLTLIVEAAGASTHEGGSV